MKQRKMEKSSNEGDTPVKLVMISEGVDDATTEFHPQRYSMRPPVGGPIKVWDQYPTHWPEVFYSVNLADVGLENQLGQKVIKLLHDRRSKIEVKMFAPTNAHIGRAGSKTTNLKQCENGSTDLTTKDNWVNVLTMNGLMQALDNMVAAWACFWEGDRSMVTLRRVVTKLREFSAVSDVNTRLRLLENFINKILEINQMKAAQRIPPMSFKEVHDMGKEYLENIADYAPVDNNRREGASSNGGFSGNTQSGHFNNKNSRFSFQNRNKNQGPKPVRNDNQMEQILKNSLSGHKYRGKEFCLYYNLRDEKGQPKCKDFRRCNRAHNCGFIARGASTPCGKPHPKFDHWKN